MTQPIPQNLNINPSHDLPADCVAVQSALSDYLDTAFDADHSQKVEQHLAVCAQCRDELALQQTLALALAQMPRSTPTPAMRARLLAQIVSETVIERVTLIRRQRGDAVSATQTIKTGPRTVVPPVSASPAARNAATVECVTRHRSESTLHTSTVCRRIYRDWEW